MSAPQDPDKGDPTNQSKRPLIPTVAILTLLVVLAIMLVIGMSVF